MSGASAANKRQRSPEVGATAISGAVDFISLLSLLPAETINKILIQAAQQHPDVGESVVSEYTKMLAAEQAKTIDFDKYSKLAWKSMNAKFSRASGSRQYEKSFEVSGEITDCINAISDATPAHASFGTKKSALETLRKIGKSLSLCEGGTLESELVKQWQMDNQLESTMMRIAQSMTVEERAAIMTKEFQDKLIELETLSSERCLFDDLKDIRAVLLNEKTGFDEKPSAFEEYMARVNAGKNSIVPPI
jgi:hypothetical protein